jgi:hypothetical protein
MNSMIFFGTPHQGTLSYNFDEMVDAESSDYETSRHNLLTQLREGSDLLDNQWKELHYIWGECMPRIVSFYETRSTATGELVAFTPPNRSSGKQN